MISQEILDKYLPTIGIECHVQLLTKTKLFVGVDNDARDKQANTTVGDLCFGLPGVLPVLNRGAVELGIRAGLALQAEINSVISFDRKHYFYPDLPKGYQITQMYQPIVLGGVVELPYSEKKVKIHHAHLEEDAGKNTHPSGADYSLVDLNRAGTPLLEIVSEPDMHSAEEARAFAKELHLLMKLAKVSNVDLFQGNMRFDINVSVAKKEAKELGIRTETKNLNSFKSIERATLYEINRQIELLERGQEITQETRGWNDDKQRTESQRGKEAAHDYRYMPEPDVPPTKISQENVDVQRQTLGLRVSQIRAKLIEAKIDAGQIETILPDDYVREIIIEAIETKVDEKKIARIVNWLVSELPGVVDLSAQTLNLPNLVRLNELAELVDNGKVSSTGAKKILIALTNDAGISARELAEELGVIQNSDSGEIEAMVVNVMQDNPKVVADIKSGQERAIGFIVGQIMKQSKGKANPQVVNKIIHQQLEGSE
ncbi:Asp-tRNA(Asn)/Glu-tRNA(Gln) amidotransferase subunit GatB [Candidatus Saccharibacteria bacterium]|jgi:aspartyl-tRNA(Asn)/glutamyl-tRNA(Gln) amidotransferase subunit B|nr:Asp-tRNA(Asn)/Glu-tRNA(Gln) amidotransferase subunit GatB [Candidatus Saccharibacteria bacterium]